MTVLESLSTREGKDKNLDDAESDKGAEAFNRNQKDMIDTESILEQLEALELELRRWSTEGM